MRLLGMVSTGKDGSRSRKHTSTWPRPSFLLRTWCSSWTISAASETRFRFKAESAYLLSFSIPEIWVRESYDSRGVGAILRAAGALGAYAAAADGWIAAGAGISDDLVIVTRRDLR